ncbi:MAG: LysM domain-containing protein [Deltaproteobacteria bacterium]|nr:MAG: LysM domain-containing protein [Deltaproteobacteria bacterium]
MIALWLSLAFAADFRVVHAGDTVESIAAAAGQSPEVLRTLNGLGADEQPRVGQLLELTDNEHAHQVGYVIALSGSGTARSPAAAETALRLGDELPVGTTVCTKAGSFATIRLAANAATGVHDDVSLLSETCVVIRGLGSHKTSRSSTLGLESGSVSVRSVSEEAEGEMNVVTRDGVTTGALGGFRVTLEPKASRTEALYAKVAVIGAEVERELPAGFGARVTEGQAPTETTPLLVPGQPRFPEDGSVLRRHDFGWTEVNRALGYRVEISATPDFSDLVFVEDVPQATWLPDRLALPRPARAWWWRVSTFDRLGYLGIPSDGQQVLEPLPSE